MCLPVRIQNYNSIVSLQGEAVLSEFGETEGGRRKGEHFGPRSQLPCAGDGQTDRVLGHATNSCVQP